MKTRYTLLAALAAMTLYLTSYSSGPTGQAGDRTGSPVSSATCGSCHNGGDFGPEATIEILEGDVPVAQYEPGKDYTLKISVATSATPFGYGYQAVVLDSSNNNAGAFGAAPDSFKLTNFAGRTYLEHARKARSSELSIEWTAPDVGTGPVTVYAAANAFNNNGGTSGDNVDEASLTIEEAVGSPTEELFGGRMAWRSYGKAGESIRLFFEESFAGEATVFDQSGRVITSAQVAGSEATLLIPGSVRGYAIVQLRDPSGARAVRRVALQ